MKIQYFLGILIYFFLIPAWSANRVSVVYKKPDHTEELEAQKFIVENSSINSIVSLLNASFHLSKPISIEFASGRVAFADLDESRVFIPYSTILDTQDQFQPLGLKPDAINDVLIHLILHEFAHLIIAMHDIPVLGKEEDAADSFASTLLIQFYDDGAEKVLNASEVHRIERENPATLKKWDFMSEHSLSVQRYYQFICFVYGSNPDQYEKLRRTTGLSKERARLCIDEFEQVSTSWAALLKPYMK